LVSPWRLDDFSIHRVASGVSGATRWSRCTAADGCTSDQIVYDVNSHAGKDIGDIKEMTAG
jgi:hypothetical protein